MESLHEFFISWYFILLGEINVNGEELAPINHKPHLDEFYFLDTTSDILCNFIGYFLWAK
jgi:hypothetical protein